MTKFSLIIPTRNHQEQLRHALRRLSLLDYDLKHFEIIIVDNCSDDQTISVVESFANRMPNLSLYEAAQIGQSHARNWGTHQAEFDHLIFVDDDVLVSPNFLKGYDQQWRKYPHAAVIGGKLTAQLIEGKISLTQRKKIEKYWWCFSQIDYGAQTYSLGPGEFLSSANFSCQKPKNGQRLFDPTLGRPTLMENRIGIEDFELCQRLILQNKQVIYSVDHRISAKIFCDKKRLTDSYLWHRFFWAGVEMYLMSEALKKSFPDFQAPLLFESKKHLQGLFSQNFFIHLHFFLSKYQLTMLLTYFFIGPFFIAE